MARSADGRSNRQEARGRFQRIGCRARQSQRNKRPDRERTSRHRHDGHRDRVVRGRVGGQQMAGCDLSGRRGAVPALAVLVHCLRRRDAAGHRIVGVRNAPSARSFGARSIAIDFAGGIASCLQSDAAGRRRRHQFLRSAVRGRSLDRLAQGARRLCARQRARDRLPGRADRDQSRREFADARRAVRAHQRHHVRHRHRRRARHDQD